MSILTHSSIIACTLYLAQTCALAQTPDHFQGKYYWTTSSLLVVTPLLEDPESPEEYFNVSTTQNCHLNQKTQLMAVVSTPKIYIRVFTGTFHIGDILVIL